MTRFEPCVLRAHELTSIGPQPSVALAQRTSCMVPGADPVDDRTFQPGRTFPQYRYTGTTLRPCHGREFVLAVPTLPAETRGHILLISSEQMQTRAAAPNGHPERVVHLRTANLELHRTDTGLRVKPGQATAHFAVHACGNDIGSVGNRVSGSMLLGVECRVHCPSRCTVYNVSHVMNLQARRFVASW
jgi:hypothetical protein